MIIQTPTPDLAKSLEFYKNLNFVVLSETKPVCVSDGSAVIHINDDRTARAGVILDSKDNFDFEALKDMSALIETDQYFLTNDGANTWIYIYKNMPSIQNNVSDNHTSILGNYAGLSVETMEIAKSEKIWEVLSFNRSMGAPEQGWISMSNGQNESVSLMKPNACPHLFFTPSLTYFNGKNNLQIIDKIKHSGVGFTEEISHFNKEGIVDNVILRDPGGLGFFIFSD